MNKENTPVYTDLEIVPNEYGNRDYTIEVSIPEFNCVCPKTSLPDFGTINITYIPNESIVELKLNKDELNLFNNSSNSVRSMNQTLNF